MLKSVRHLFFEREIELRERLFRMILLVGEIVSAFGIVETGLLMNTTKLIIPLLFLFAVMGIALIATLKYRKFEFSVVVVGLVLIVVVFPLMFFFCGGVESGAMVWFSLELVYVFMMFSGRKMVCFILMCIVMDCATFGFAYAHPELITPVDSLYNIYFDSFFSVIAVGIAIGGMLKFQMKMFEMERAVVLSQKEELQKMGESKNAFFANMSHEIRTPINTVIGLNEMILRQNVSSEIQEYSRYIQMASKMLLSLVNDVLDMSQMEMKKMEIIPVEYQTKELFEELVDMVQVRMKEKKLDFCVEIDKNMPSVLFGDEKRIQQILLNILTNAVKYTEKGSVTFSVYAEPIDKDHVRMKISVADTGIGIRKEDLEYLYDTFKRMDKNRNTKIEGSGLGLSITKQLLDLMGGEITVDSIYTKGSTFTVVLEQKVIEETPIGVIDFFEKKNDTLYQYIPCFEAPEARILIVDDNPMNTMVEEQLLRDTKLQIDIARSGSECLERTKLKYYHVILMDYLMVDMTGAEVLKQLRKQENGLCRETKVLLVTAASFTEAQHISRENGFDGVLEKPIVGQQLEKELLKVLPEDIIEHCTVDFGSESKELGVNRVFGRKKKHICITTDCVCDLPQEYLELFDIKMMYLYIKTEKGRFSDTEEIDSDNLSQYISSSKSTASADSVSIEEYEEFFAEALTRAEHVLHVSMAQNAGKSFGVAVTAAQGFDHVEVIDSGQISCGQGMIVLLAARMAMEGCKKEEICAAIDKYKGRIGSYFMLPSIGIFHQNGYASKGKVAICKLFQVHPVIYMKQSKPSVIGAHRGNLEYAWKRFIRSHLWRKNRICKDVIFITHVGCSVKQLEFIKKEILKCIPFENVIIQKGSFSTACNAGKLTIGFSYFRIK